MSRLSCVFSFNLFESFISIDKNKLPIRKTAELHTVLKLELPAAAFIATMNFIVSCHIIRARQFF